MAASQDPFTPDDITANAAAAMSDIRGVLGRLAPAERAAFWHAVDLLYRAPFGSPMSTKEARPIQHGVARGLERLHPLVWQDGSDGDGRDRRSAEAAAEIQTFAIQTVSAGSETPP